MDDVKVRQLPISCICKGCGTYETFLVPFSGMQARARGADVRLAFPDLTESQYGTLLTQLCESCQKQLEKGYQER